MASAMKVPLIEHEFRASGRREHGMLECYPEALTGIACFDEVDTVAALRQEHSKNRHCVVDPKSCRDSSLVKYKIWPIIQPSLSNRDRLRLHERRFANGRS